VKEEKRELPGAVEDDRKTFERCMAKSSNLRSHNRVCNAW
jgi:hypothetical protein